MSLHMSGEELEVQGLYSDFFLRIKIVAKFRTSHENEFKCKLKVKLFYFASYRYRIVCIVWYPMVSYGRAWHCFISSCITLHGMVSYGVVSYGVV